MIHFVGAGPGDVDLITIKGRRLLEEADQVIYAGSLVWDEHLRFCKAGARQLNSASMTLEEVTQALEEGEAQGWQTVRLHTGDPGLFGTIGEQIRWAEEKNIPYQVVPGVSSFSAAAASLHKEFTLPGVSQTLILTRIEGRTPVPETEDLAALARHQCSMAIFLSVQMIDKVVAKLKEGYGRGNVPVAVVYKASWPDQEVLQGTLDDIANKVKAAGINKTSQILVGDFLASDFERSKLYDPHFSHAERQAQRQGT